ncbi:type II secretion system F family protein [Streptomyces roseifaciens]|uniref:type II secretion system F family protein n=1 Tax=Streptomyces roseifaciens TaxID=1488406 RepID=UPI0007182DC5|nr:type II secretion system F family protein [Streptomyces roseifaciens]
MDKFVLLAIGATLLCCVLAIVGVHVYATGRAQREALVDRLTQQGPEVRTGGRRPAFRGIDRRIRKTSFGKKIELRLAATGLRITPGQFFVGMIGATVGMWVIAGMLLAPFFGPIAAIAGLWGAFAYLNWQRQKRNERFINQLPELSRVVANATQAGLALRTALAMAAEELESPAGDELARVADQLAVGHTLDDALDELAKRLPSRELVVLVTTLVLSNKAGGTVVSSLRSLTVTLEERKETRREVRTQLSQVTATAYIVPGMGLGALLIMDRIWPGALDKITGSVIGQGAMIVSIGLYGLGFFLVRRLGKIDV